MTTFREQISSEAAQALHDNLDELLDSTAGWVIIANLENQKVSDSYLGVCDSCVATMGSHITADAVAAGVLLEEGVAKLHGHKHPKQPQHKHKER